jgi:hypothetical protein
MRMARLIAEKTTHHRPAFSFLFLVITLGES